MPGKDASVELQYLGLQRAQLAAESSKTRAGQLWEPAVGWIGNDFQQLLDTPAPDGGDNPELGKIGADRINDGCLLTDEEMARPVEHEAALLLDRLGRHEPHVGSRDRLANRLRVRGVVLLPLDVGLHIGRRHQSHCMPQRLQFARPMVR
jgi:hypothetical protein